MAAQKVARHPESKLRLALLALGMLSLLLGIGMGLQRLGWSLPLSMPALSHSWLMVGGFFGTLISLERAAAVRRRWGYLAPACSALGALMIAFYPMPTPGWLLLNLASLMLIVIYGYLYYHHRVFHHGLMGVGALCWLVGNLVWWLAEFSLNLLAYKGVLFWVAFLLLTIVAERLELNRLFKSSVGSVVWITAGLVALLAGILLALFANRAGLALFGGGLLLIAAWLIRFDTARYTMKAAGLTGFTGCTLMVGYFWLGLAGVAALQMPELSAGVWMDALLHAFFLGFVFSMVFGHAPIIFPSVLGWQIPYHPRFYSHVVLLNGSLLLRVVGDLLAQHTLRQWGGLLNGFSILLFLLNTASATFLARHVAGRR